MLITAKKILIPKRPFSTPLANMIYEYLVKVAKRRGTCTYKDIGQKFGIPWQHDSLSPLLAEISIHTHREWGFMLSSIVVNGKTPGNGFYILAWDIYKTLPANFLIKEQGKTHAWADSAMMAA